MTYPTYISVEQQGHIVEIQVNDMAIEFDIDYLDELIEKLNELNK